MSVRSSQRFTRHQPCPICAGFDDAPRSKGVRCFGFLSDDGGYAHCSREEFAGGLRFSENSQTFAHRLEGDCRCGTRHDPSLAPLSAKKKFEAVYDYNDDQGKLLYQVVRFKPKGFAQRRPSGSGSWLWNLDGVRRVLCHLPEALAASTVFVAEGEKDCNSLHKIGLVATTNAGGCGKWRPEYSESLRGKHVTILPDNDEPGRKHALGVARSLLGTAASVKIAELPGTKDVSAWLAAGHDKDELLQLAGKAPTLDLSGLADLKRKWGLADRESEGDSSNNEHDREIKRLAGLSELEYETQRDKAAKKLGFRKPILDRLVKLERLDTDNDTQGQGHAFELADPEPWDKPIDGEQLLSEFEKTINKYVVLPAHGDTAAVLWVLFCHLHKTASISPILAVTSPTAACGKTTLLTLLAALCPRAIAASGFSVAALFRVIEASHPTLLIDELDSFLSGDEYLRGFLNSGHSLGGARYVRVVKIGNDNFEARAFSTWCPKMLCAIGKLPNTIVSRSITLEMQRMKAGEKVALLRADRLDHLKPLCRKLALWAADNASRLSDDPALPEQLRGRNADNWRILVAIANAVGGDWPERARQAAVVLSAGEDSQAASELLLHDVSSLFEEHEADRLPTTEILQALNRLDTRPWPEWDHEKPLSARGLARLLGSFGIQPVSIRCDDGSTPKGYKLSDFADSLARYSSPPDPPILSATTPQANRDGPLSDFLSATTFPLVADRKRTKPNKDGGCGVVADRNPLKPGEAHKRVEL